MDRLVRRLTENVPQRDVDGGCRANLDARRAEADIGGKQQVGDAVDLQRVPADQLRRDIAMDMGCNGVCAAKRLTQPDDAFIGVHQHPQNVVQLRKLYGFDRCYLHGTSR